MSGTLAKVSPIISKTKTVVSQPTPADKMPAWIKVFLIESISLKTTLNLLAYRLTPAKNTKSMEVTQ